MKNPLPFKLVLKHLQSLWTPDATALSKHSASKGGFWTAFSRWTLDSPSLKLWWTGVGRWTAVVIPSRRALKALVSGIFCAVILPIVLFALVPESPSPAAAVGMEPLEKIMEVDENLILRPGGGIRAKGPLTERALALASTDAVKSQLEYLLSNKREEIRRSLSLSTRYLPHINPILEEYGLPQELAYLCIIESGYNLSARSHAGAVGMWQMIRATSRRFDLVTDNWVDDRLDFVKSTEGAARFFLYLKDRFDDWDHILAAYNAGEGRVKKAIKKARRQNLDPEFSNLGLPRETRIYVPAFYAALLIALEPERYGIFPDYQPTLDFFEINIPGGVPLATVSRHIGCDMEDLRYLNPSILKNRVPFKDGGFAMRIPCSVQQDRAMIVASSLNEVQYVSYRVRHGDTIWDISRRFGVSMSRISRAGQQRGNLSKIFPGEILLVALTAGEIG